MTEQIYSENTRKIIQNKKQIENALKVNMEIKGNVVFLEGKAEDELVALEFLEAIDLGFSIPKALMLKEEGFVFEKISIKKLAKRKDLSQVRARVIGTKRKALNTIEDLSDTFIAVHDNHVGIIGSYENVKKAVFVLKRIITGSKHANMYAWLENQKIIEKLKF